MHVIIVQDGEDYDQLVMARQSIAGSICDVNSHFSVHIADVHVVQPDCVIVIRDHINQVSYTDEVRIDIKDL